MEALEVAGSVVSLVTILGQLIQSARQLHDFWSSVKDVPKSLEWFTEDLNIIREILEAIHPQLMQGSATIGSSTALRLLKKCAISIGNLEAFVKPLQSGPGDSRKAKTWKSIKAVFLSDKIKSYRENLESLKVTLLLAQNHITECVLSVIFTSLLRLNISREHSKAQAAAGRSPHTIRRLHPRKAGAN
jgi:hypothetical protein